jgi:predicted nucleotidyltransferase
MTHEDRLAVARDLAGRILEKYGDAVLGVAIYGSVARNADTQHSDLEMLVATTEIISEHDTEYVHIISGLKVEINYEQAENYLLRPTTEFTRPPWAPNGGSQELFEVGQ